MQETYIRVITNEVIELARKGEFEIILNKEINVSKWVKTLLNKDSGICTIGEMLSILSVENDLRVLLSGRLNNHFTENHEHIVRSTFKLILID